MSQEITDKMIRKMASGIAIVDKPDVVVSEVEAVEDEASVRSVREWKETPDVLDYGKQFVPVKKMYGGKVREMRPDGVYANLVCPEGKLYCIKIEQGDAVVIVRNGGDFIDMVVKGATNKAEALRAVARKFIRIINYTTGV